MAKPRHAAPLEMLRPVASSGSRPRVAVLSKADCSGKPDGVGVGVGAPERVCEGLPVRDGVCVGVLAPDGVGDPVPVRLGVTLRLCVSLGDPVAVPLLVVLGVAVPDGVPEPLWLCVCV